MPKKDKIKKDKTQADGTRVFGFYELDLESMPQGRKKKVKDKIKKEKDK